jgi:hypothetical protein
MIRPSFLSTERSQLDITGNSPAYSTESFEDTTTAPIPTPAPLHWTPLGRLAFRIAFIYFFCFLFLFGNGTLFQIIPVVGHWIQQKLTWPFNHLAEWVGQHLFHLSGLAAHWHPTGSGDTTLHWILSGLFVTFALVGGLLWTAIATLRRNRRTEYQTLYAWLRFLLRLTVGMFMVGYGFAKLFPIQMAPISIAILNEPFGQTSPMTLLWSLIGFNPIYESICGAAEIIGGVLFLFRRTALLGAIVSAFVLANVVLYNFFFDVPVKLFAANLLLSCLFLVLPDVSALFRFFWNHQPAAPTGVWVPPATRRSFRIATLIVEIIFVASFLVIQPYQLVSYWRHTEVALKTPPPMYGAWHIDPAHTTPNALNTGEGLPATDIYFDSAVRAFTRSSDGVLWRSYLTLDAKAHTVKMGVFPGRPIDYAWQMPNSNQLILISVPPSPPKLDPKHKADAKVKPKPTPPFTPVTLTLTRTPLPTHYPLLDRGFHFVNQWGLER